MFSTEIKAGIKKGNPEAYQEVFRILYPRLKGYSRLFIPDDDDAEDIIQDTFVALWEKRQSLKQDGNIESLVFVILRNRCLNYLKDKRFSSGNIDFEQLNLSELQHLYQLDMLEREENKLEDILLATIDDAVNSLPEKMKSVFIQCKIQGKKQKEVAHAMGISVKTVEKHIAKAKVLIENQLKLHYPSILGLFILMVA